MDMPGTLFVDIDGTLLHSVTGEPLPGAVEWVNHAYDSGQMIVLTTLRGDYFPPGHKFSREETLKTLADIGLHFSAIVWDSPSPRTVINDDGCSAQQHQKDTEWP